MAPAGAKAAAPAMVRAQRSCPRTIPYAGAIAPAGPDFEAAGPDFSEAAGPDFSVATSTGPDFSEAVGPDFSEATEPNVKRCRGGPLNKDCLCRYKIDTAIC